MGAGSKYRDSTGLRVGMGGIAFLCDLLKWRTTDLDWTVN